MIPHFTGWTAGFMGLLDAALVFSFVSHIASVGRKSVHSPEASAGIALMVYFSGQGLVRSGTWLNVHHLIPIASNILIVTGTIIAVVGAICAVRIFSRRTWRIMPWVYYVTASAGVSGMVEWWMMG